MIPRCDVHVGRDPSSRRSVRFYRAWCSRPRVPSSKEAHQLSSWRAALGLCSASCSAAAMSSSGSEFMALVAFCTRRLAARIPPRSLDVFEDFLHVV